MVCKECAYFWQDTIGERPHCHFEPLSAMDIPPCEYSDDGYSENDDCDDEEYDFNDDVDETFYDPYSGCDRYE